jgi:tRNA(Ile)-lysidine synthetase-like protein
VAERSYDRLVLRPPTATVPPPDPLVVPGPGAYEFGDFLVTVLDLGCSGDTFPLALRVASAGDRVKLASGHHKKVVELLQAARVARPERARLPLLVSSDGSQVLCIGDLSVNLLPVSRLGLRLTRRQRVQ